MGNNLNELNSIMFDALRQVMDKSLSKDALQTEIERSRAVAGLAEKVINAGQLAVKTAVIIASQDATPEQMPELLSDTKSPDSKQLPLKRRSYKAIAADFDENEYD